MQDSGFFREKRPKSDDRGVRLQFSGRSSPSGCRQWGPRIKARIIERSRKFAPSSKPMWCLRIFRETLFVRMPKQRKPLKFFAQSQLGLLLTLITTLDISDKALFVQRADRTRCPLECRSGIIGDYQRLVPALREYRSPKSDELSHFSNELFASASRPEINSGQLCACRLPRNFRSYCMGGGIGPRRRFGHFMPGDEP
jgi:hypothetical protein